MRPSVKAAFVFFVAMVAMFGLSFAWNERAEAIEANINVPGYVQMGECPPNANGLYPGVHLKICGAPASQAEAYVSGGEWHNYGARYNPATRQTTWTYFAGGMVTYPDGRDCAVLSTQVLPGQGTTSIWIDAQTHTVAIGADAGECAATANNQLLVRRDWGEVTSAKRGANIVGQGRKTTPNDAPLHGAIANARVGEGSSANWAGPGGIVGMEAQVETRYGSTGTVDATLYGGAVFEDGAQFGTLCGLCLPPITQGMANYAIRTQGGKVELNGVDLLAKIAELEARLAALEKKP